MRHGMMRPHTLMSVVAQLCQIHDWALNDAPLQPGLRTIRHGDTVLINGDDDNDAPFIGIVHQVLAAASPASTELVVSYQKLSPV